MVNTPKSGDVVLPLQGLSARVSPESQFSVSAPPSA